MTEKTFIKLLSDLNEGVQVTELTFFHLVENVYYGFYWNYSVQQLKNHSDLFPKKMYLIKNELGNWVSLVYNANSDLHWFTLKEWRGKSVLSKALNKYILPDIFIRSKAKEIIISIDPNIEEYLASKNLALKLGFKKCNLQSDSEYYRKPRPRKLNAVAPIRDKVIFTELVALSRLITNYCHLFYTLSASTTISKAAHKVLLPFEKGLNNLKYDIEDLIWDEEQKAQQS